MANWNNPILTSLYTDVINELKARDVELATQFDGASPTNLPTNTIRWSSTNNRWEKWNGSAWNALSTSYRLGNIDNTIIGANVAVAGTFTTLNSSGASTHSGQVTFSNATAPIISAKIGPNNTQQHAVPAVASDTIALLAATQTFTNKTLTSPAIGGTATGDFAFSGQVTFNNATAPIISAKIGPNNTQQHTIPAVASDTIALLAATQTFTNKTLTNPAINGGAVNNTPIGATTPSTGAFTSLTSNAQSNFTSTDSLGLPSGTTAQRGTPARPAIRYNTTIGGFEGYNGSAWNTIGATTTPAVDVQTFNSSGTWSKPNAGTMALIRVWGAGGSGGRGGSSSNGRAGGGGGGAYKELLIPLSSLGSTATVTVGAGGAARSTAGNGNNGGDSTFVSGSITVTGFGGGGGQGNLNASYGGGGGGSLTAGARYVSVSDAWAGEPDGGNSGKYALLWGGGGGGDGLSTGPQAPLPTTFGGGGGGSASNISPNTTTGSVSLYAGNGGDGSFSSGTPGGTGVQPSGGGGGQGANGGSSGAGADGRVVVIVW